MTEAAPPGAGPYREDAAGRRRATVFLGTALALGMSTWFSASAVIPQLRAEWDLSDTSAAWLTIAVQLGFVVGAVLSSTLNIADIVPLRTTILAGCLGAAAANLALLIADSPAEALPLRFTTGFFLAGVYPPGFKLMATWTMRKRGTALGAMSAALVLGSASPHLVNSWGGLEWTTVVLVTSLLTIVAGAVAFSFVREGPFPFPKAIFDPTQIGRVFRNRRVLLASLGYFGHMWELYAMWAWFVAFYGAHLSAGGNASRTAGPLVTFMVIGVGAFGCYLGGILGDRWGRAKTAMLSLAISGTCSLTVGLLFEGPTWLVVAVGLVWGFWIAPDSAQFSTMVTEFADQSYVGTALTLQLAVGFTLTVGTIWLIPYLEEVVSWRWAFAFLVPGPVLGLIAMSKLKRSLKAPG
ncbi:MAG TPA: MFS transporter [Actinomycetota bacterium]|nr:MFS transporter [Actinomycetota bacterium]